MKRLILLFTLLPFINYSQYTAIPDPNFEQALINLGYDTVLNGQVLSSNISSIDSLDLSFQNITDLTGIEDFTDLAKLVCHTNQLTSLDVSQNTYLVELFCQLNNQLTSLDLSNNTLLTKLACSANGLTSLDLSYNTALIELNCTFNALSSLDISQNTALTFLNCYGNQLTSLDVSQNTALTYLSCYNNQLSCLNIKNGNNTNFNFFWAQDNPNLSCIEVDDPAWATQNWTVIDAGVIFSNNCNYPSGCFSSPTTIKEQSFSVLLHPNPTNKLITLDIEGYNGSVNVEVYDLTGNLLQSTTNTTISMGEYAKGIYVFKVAYGDIVEKLKVVKE